MKGLTKQIYLGNTIMTGKLEVAQNIITTNNFIEYVIYFIVYC